jgi:tetratricopeptide (TPR) repeat protein
MNDFKTNHHLDLEMDTTHKIPETGDPSSIAPHEPAETETTINGTPLNELSRLGYQHLRANALHDAIDCFRQILDHQPDNNYALVGIGDSYRKKGRFNDAATYYQRCLELFPTNNYALFGLADCYRSLKQFHRAIAVWEDYLLIDDKNVTVLTRVADAYRKTRNLKRGKELYQRVMEIEPDNAYALIGMGHLYYDFKEFADALNCWSRMYEISREHVDIRVLTSMGNCHRKMKSYREGIPLFETALEREPGNFYALFGIADCYRGLNRTEDSLRYWEMILASAPDNKLILTRAGDALRILGRISEARTLYQRALDVEYDIWAVHGLAQLSRLEGRHAVAAETLESLLRYDSRLHRVFPDLLDSHYRAGNHQAIRDTIERFNRLHPVPARLQAEFEAVRRSIG